MPNIGPMEIAIVLIIALIVFGPKRLPELGKVGAIDVSDQQVRHRRTHLAIRRVGADHV